MNQQEAEQQYQRIFAVFPSYREYLEQQPDPNATLDGWCEMLKRCKAADVVLVVDRIVGGEDPPRDDFTTKDMLPLTIRGRAGKIADDRAEAERVARLRQQGTSRGSFQTVARWPIGRIAVTLGAMRKRHLISKEENDQRMIDLLAWDSGSSEPEWLDEKFKEWSRKNETRSPFTNPSPTARKR